MMGKSQIYMGDPPLTIPHSSLPPPGPGTHATRALSSALPPLDDEPHLAGWILAVGVFLVAVRSEGGQAVA